VGDSTWAAARFTGSRVCLDTSSQGSADAPPWALCYRPLRGLGEKLFRNALRRQEPQRSPSGGGLRRSSKEV